MRLVKIIWVVIVFSILTVLTQIGGLIYLASFLLHNTVNKRIATKYLQQTLKFGVFLIMYLLATLFLVPLIARSFGRVPMPLTETTHLRPLNVLNWLLNRNYVRPGLKQAALEVAKQMNEQFPGTTLNYLDASFPFFNKFPLLPHLSHNDGKKVDFSFCYVDSKTNKPSNSAPSFIGYGICEEPRLNEVNTTIFCTQHGRWQYNLLREIVPQGNKANYIFDSVRTRALVVLFASKPIVGKIFIEPHLKARLMLTSSKIRFQGCGAVRHDDHLHVQIK